MGLRAAVVGADSKIFDTKAKRSSAADKVLFIPSGAGVSVRFLTQSSEWVYFKEFWDPALGRYVIETDENYDEYEERGIFGSTRFLAAALEKASNRVVAVKLPKTLADNIRLKEEKGKWGALTDFDLDLSKEGTGQGTVYNAEFDGQSNVDVSRYELPDLFEILNELAYGSEDSQDDPIEEEPRAPKKKYSLNKGRQ